MKTKYDWSNVSNGTKYIFTDQDGDVFESNFEPLLGDYGWRGAGLSSWWFSNCESFRGDWRESLEERPQ